MKKMIKKSIMILTVTALLIASLTGCGSSGSSGGGGGGTNGDGTTAGSGASTKMSETYSGEYVSAGWQDGDNRSAGGRCHIRLL